MKSAEFGFGLHTIDLQTIESQAFETDGLEHPLLH